LAITWETEFLGRDEEINQLLDNLEKARNKHGNITFITGEAGIGKTRLAVELLKQKQELNFEFLMGQCIYREGTDPYLPFIDMFKGYLSSHPYLAKAIQTSFKSSDNVIFDFYSVEKERYSPTNAKEQRYSSQSEKKVKKSTKSGRKRVGKYSNDIEKNSNEFGINNGRSEYVDQQIVEGKNRMFETVLRMIIGISKKQPLIIFIDDVHWADESSLHLLHYLARNIKKQPILIVCAYRTEEVDVTSGKVDPLQEFITRLGTENLFSKIELRRLDQNQTMEIVGNFLDVQHVPKDFADLIYKETEGNPFFIKEVLKTLIQDGSLEIVNDRLELQISPDEIVIPMSIKELINLRLQRLDDDSVDLLEYASVIGNEFHFDLMSNIVDIPESKLINILSKLTEAKIIEEVSSEKSLTWEFTHNKIHEVIYDNLNENKKRLIHLRLAKFIEDSMVENIDEVVYDLAYHFYNGLDFDRALSYAIEGGEKAMRSYANKEALDLYTISLDSLRLIDDKLANTSHYKEKKIEVLAKLGTLHKTICDWEKALNYFEQIIPVCDDISDPQTKSQTFLDIGWVFEQRNYYGEAKKYFEKSLELAKKNDDDFIVSEAYRGLGTVLEYEGDFEAALECYSISRKYAESNDDVVNLAKVHNAFGRIYNIQANYPKAIDHKEKSIHIFEKLNHLPDLAKAYASLGSTYYDMGEMDKNIEFNEKCIELADQISDLRTKGFGLSNSVSALVKENKLKKALDYAESAYEIFRKLEEPEMVALSYMNFGKIFKQKKDWPTAIDNFKSAVELMENLNVPHHLAECYKQFSDIYDNKGESKKSDYYLKKAEDIYNSLSVAVEDK
jgi:tetratricopeptide (TPR) repeat protein